MNFSATILEEAGAPEIFYVFIDHLFKNNQ
jgi:hypothetical protein